MNLFLACLSLIPRNFRVKFISLNYFISRQMKSVGFLYMVGQRLLSRTIRQSWGTVDCSWMAIEHIWKPFSVLWENTILQLQCFICVIIVCGVHKKPNQWVFAMNATVCVCLSSTTCPETHFALFAFIACSTVQTDLNGWLVRQLSAAHGVELLFYDLERRLAKPENRLWPENVHTVAVWMAATLSQFHCHSLNPSSSEQSRAEPLLAGDKHEVLLLLFASSRHHRPARLSHMWTPGSSKRCTCSLKPHKESQHTKLGLFVLWCVSVLFVLNDSHNRNKVLVTL